jgi:hypothetical protein
MATIWTSPATIAAPKAIISASISLARRFTRSFP